MKNTLRSLLVPAMLAALLAAPALSRPRPAAAAQDRATAHETVGIRALLEQPTDFITSHPLWIIREWRNPENFAYDMIRHSRKIRAGQFVYDAARYEKIGGTIAIKGNLLTTVGATYLWNKALVTGGPPQTIDAAHCRILSDDSSTAATAGDTTSTATAGGTHQYWAQASSVTQSTSTLQIVASFDANSGNFAWQSLGTEVGANATASGTALSSGGILINHKVISSGTKSNPSVWQVTESLSLGP